MQLQFKSQYASITPFDLTELSDFSVITGINGSGKSQLLEAIKNKNVVIRDLKIPRIVLFNYENFRLDNEPSFNGHQLSAERESAWQYHQQHIMPQVKNWRTSLGDNYEEIKQEASFTASIGPLSPMKNQVGMPERRTYTLLVTDFSFSL